MKLRFSLRAMFAAVTLVAATSAWIAHERRIVPERKYIDAWARINDGASGVSKSKQRPSVSWVRRFMGDEGAEAFIVPFDASEWEKDRIKAAFPEAEIIETPRLYGAFPRIPTPLPGEPPRDSDAKR
jgi:hypothetical protein